MKNYEIISILNIYMHQKEEGKKLTLPAEVAWKRRLNMNALLKAKEVIDEAVQELQKEYMDDDHSEKTKTESGEEARMVKKEFIDEFSKKQAEIMTQDTPVSLKKIKIGDISGVDVDDEDMDTLVFMIEEETDG